MKNGIWGKDHSQVNRDTVGESDLGVQRHSHSTSV